MSQEEILKNGFLDEKLELSVKDLRFAHKDAYHMASELNELMYEIEQEFIGKESTSIELYIYTVFSQIHNSCQTYILLVERGLYADSQIILRSIYEKIFKLMIVIEDEGYLKRFLKDSLKQGISTLNRIKSKKLFKLISEDIVDSRIKEFTDALNQMNEVKLPSDLGKISEMIKMDMQYIYYKLLSEYTHNDLVVSMKHLIFEDEGVIINGSQIYEGKIPEEILRYTECVEYAVKALSNYLNKPNYYNKLQNIQEKYDYLWNKSK